MQGKQIMEKKKALELIKLEVLGCLSKQDKEVFEGMKLNTDDFPWKELGDYQHLVTLIPSTLEIIYPASDQKDKTALKLYNIRDEIKAKIEAKKASEISAKQVEQEIIIEEKPLVDEGLDFQLNSESQKKPEFEPGIEIEEKVLVQTEEGIQITDGKTLLNQESPFKIKSNFKEKAETGNLIQDFKIDTESNVTVKQPTEKDLVEKLVKEYFKSHFDGELELLKNRTKTNRILSLIFFIVSVILIIALYFFK